MTVVKDALMIIGAGIFQIPAIKIAKKMGLKVLVTDRDNLAPGKALADYFELASTRDEQKNIEIAKQYAKNKLNLRGVLTIGTDFTYTVSCVAQALSLPGVPPEIALKATNKIEMRKQLKKHQVPCPDFIEVKKLTDIADFIKEKGLPVVIKPADNMGARGVRKIEKATDLKKAFETAKKNSFSETVIIEEYMEGEEVSIDTLVYRGKVYPLTIADRIITFPPYFIEIGHTIPSILPQNVLDDVINVMEKGVKALGIDFSASKGDIKITKEGAKIGEMTTRLSGGFHSQYTDPLSTGMNSIKAAIDIAIGNELNLNDITPKYHHAAAERALLPGFGKIKKIEGVEKAQKIKGIKKIVLNVGQGDTLYPFTSNIGKAGHVIAFGATRKEAIEQAEKAQKTIKFYF